MPRKSAEARAGAHFRAGGKPPPPPSHLSARAKQLWKRITGTRAYDYFDPASLILLGQFVQLCALQEKNFANMQWNPTSPLAQKQCATLQAAINSTAVKLRITPSAVLSKKDGRLDERELDLGDNVLLFGGDGGMRF